MKKRSKIQSVNGELELPEPIIQRIQSFLTAKQAAQTTLLSKPWHKAWLTRPNLDFDDSDFQAKPQPRFQRYGLLLPKPRSPTVTFSNFATKTIQRYEESNLKIESFRLFMGAESPYGDHSVVANELILRALKLGATRLSVRIVQIGQLVLPPEVFGDENVVGLSLERCEIDVPSVRCSRLESLSLKYVKMRTDVIFDVFSSCPLIENLSLSSVHDYGFKKRRGAELVGPVRPVSLCKLRCLTLCGVEFDTLFLDDLSRKFPLLKELTIQPCDERDEIRICSHSLERLTVLKETERNEGPKRLRLTLDVPSIRKFTFRGAFFPSLSFGSVSGEWESDLSVFRYSRLSALWFRKLNKLLTELSGSKISLSLHFYSGASFDYELGDIQGCPNHAVENLMIDTVNLPSLCCYALWDGLFRLCCPKFITQDLDPKSSSNWKTNYHLLCKTLIQGIDEKFQFPNQFMYGLHDLEEVNGQIFDEVAVEWRSLPMQSLLDFSTKPKKKRKIRFQLKWKQ